MAWLLGAIFLVSILYLNWTYSFSSDDCVYALSSVQPTNGVRPPLGTIENAWLENWHDGHRPVVHIFVRIFTGCFDKWVFNFANTAMMGIFVFCVFRLAKRRFSIDFHSLSLLLFLVFFVLCKGESYLWCAGSVNYLWAGTGSLLFCVIVEKLEHGDRSWPSIALYSLIALIAGWLQEAFVLPICSALIVYYLLNCKSVTVKKLIVLLFYMIGVVLLVRIAGRRASTIPSFSVASFCMTLLKIAVAIKAVWILMAAFLFRKDKKAFVARNLFPLLVVGASICMIAIIGFNGERCLWAANLFSIVILVREYTPSLKLAYLLSFATVSTLGICCCLGYRIKCEFDDFTRQYMASENGLCWHNRVNCGPFARFFHQVIYTWQEGLHGRCYGEFHGRNISPVALPKPDYDALVAGAFCVPSNRLNVALEAYTTPQSNAIVVPLPDEMAMPKTVNVVYDFPKGFVFKIKQEIAMRNNSPVADPSLPREVFINGERFAFIPKIPGSDPYIRDITFQQSNH